MSRRAPHILTALLAVLVLAGSLSAQQLSTTPFGQGTHALRRILFDLELKPIEGLRGLTEPERTLVIVLGDTDILGDLPGGPRAFVDRGGALLVATDRPTRDRQLQTPFGVTVLGVRVQRNPPHEEMNYRGRPDCPLIHPPAGKGADFRLFRRPSLPNMRSLLQTVATNRPAALAFPSAEKKLLTDAASLPPGCQYTLSGEGWAVPPTNPREIPPFGALGEVGKGRVLVLADHSLFINDMLLQPDNDNIDFTYNCLDWLTDGNPRRDRVLFVEEGMVKTSFDIPLKELPPTLPPPNALVPLVNAFLAEMEKSDAKGETTFDRIAREMDKDNYLPRYLAILGTLVFAIYGLYRISWNRFRPEVGVPLLPAALARQPVGRNVLEQRHRALLAHGNLWEAARGLARVCFEQAATRTEGEPIFRVRGGWWRRWTLGAKARRLWRLAYGKHPVPVSRRAFARLPREIEEVRAALAAGTLQMSVGSGSPSPPLRGRGVGVRGS